MRKALVRSLALLAAGAVTPAFGGVVYVPVIGTGGGADGATEVWVSNSDAAAHGFATTFLEADSNGTVRQGKPGQTSVSPGGALRLGSGAPAGHFGLLEVDAATQLAVDARLTATPAQGAASTSRLPMISSENAIAAGGIAQVLGLERSPDVESTDLYLVNLGKTSAQCDAKLYRSDGTLLVAPATVAVRPLSLRRFADVLNLLGQSQVSDVRAQLSCNQPFYAFATLAGAGKSGITVRQPSASGLSTLGEETLDRPLPAGTTLLYQARGVNLVPSREQEVNIIRIPVERELTLKRMVVELDFTPGPWHPGQNDGPHAIIWLHRGTFRSNTIANVNVHGPNKNKIRMNQNIDLPGLQDTLGQQGGLYEQGKQYHFLYTYDAENKTINCTVTQGSTVINNFNFPSSAEHRRLIVPATGLVAVLGHMSGLEFEVTSYGWTYSNLRISVASY